MSKTVLKDTNFTPSLVNMTKKYGLITAGVFGRVWRYCQMDEGICTASQTKIGEDLRLKRETVWHHIRILVRDGYLKDLTPDYVNRPHHYGDTGKAGEEEAAVLKTDSAVLKTDSGCTQNIQHAVLKTDAKIVLKKEEETIRETEKILSFEEQQIQELNQLQEQNHSKEEASELINTSKPEALTREEVNKVFEEELRLNIAEGEWDGLAALAAAHGKAATSQFIEWWKINGSEPRYWTARKMEALFPQAFPQTFDRVTASPIEPAETPALDKLAEDSAHKWATSLLPYP
jgi:DNA-binding Lrp family transcriptional regulator